MLRRTATLCLLLITATALSARVRVAAYEDPRSSIDVVLAIDDEGYLYLVDATGWAKVNEEPCPTAGPYDLDTFYDASIEDIVALVIDGEGRVYAAGTGEWLTITGTPTEGTAPYLISAFYSDGEDTTLLNLLDAGGQLLMWYWEEESFNAVLDPLPAAESYSMTDHFELGDDSCLLHAVDSTGVVYAFLADGWHGFPIAVEGEPPFQIGILDTSVGVIDLIVAADGEVTFIKDAEEATTLSATLDGEPPYDFDAAHTPGTDNYSLYLIDSKGVLFIYDGENWPQVLDGFPE
ncbi:hypothetical protein K8R78_04725 [bacterium]|nr:hypothetical protein [bacterium]